MSFRGSKSKPKTESGPSTSRMASPSRGPRSSAIESTIGSNTHIEGDIQGDGGLRVDGIVQGSIELTGNLVVTESAKIRAEIKASNISVAGAVQGNITATRIEILDTGRVWGDLTVKSLLVNEGGTTEAEHALQSTSPCIDAGVDVSLTRDYAGNGVPDGAAPNIGAYEGELAAMMMMMGVG